MPMNRVIREKRKEKGLTQEQVADYLGVTAPAVNKWEKGATCPDVSILPPLARLLGIDLNELFCFNMRLSEQEINRFGKEVTDAASSEGTGKGFEMAEAKIREYPGCIDLIYTMAIVMEGFMILHGTSGEEKEKYDSRITAWYEYVVQNGDENKELKDRAMFMLTPRYMNREEYDKAEELLMELPERSALDKNTIKSQLLFRKGETGEAAQILERKLLTEISGVQSTLLGLMEIEMKEGNMENAARLSEMSVETAKLFDIGPYYELIGPLQLALEEKDAEKSIGILDKILNAARKPWSYTDSEVYRHLPKIPADSGQETKGFSLVSAWKAAAENDPRASFLLKDKRFNALMEKWKDK